MDKVLSNAEASQSPTQPYAVSNDKLDWRRSISDHVAYALLVYTGLQIFVTIAALKSVSGSIMPYLCLVVLVAAIIPGCRMFEGRWEKLSDEEASDLALAPAYRRDRALIWLGAICLPFLLTGFCKVVALI